MRGGDGTVILALHFELAKQIHVGKSGTCSAPACGFVGLALDGRVKTMRVIAGEQAVDGTLFMHVGGYSDVSGQMSF